jgi:signal recognition particle receptor subunit beta
LLVFANKQDMKEAAPVPEISTSLGLTSIKDRQWHIEKSSAINGDGLGEGLDWLAETIKTKGKT